MKGGYVEGDFLIRGMKQIFYRRGYNQKGGYNRGDKNIGMDIQRGLKKKLV